MKKKIAFLLIALNMCFSACTSNNVSESTASYETSLSQETAASDIDSSSLSGVLSEDDSQNSDAAIYAYLNALFDSPENPSNWSDEQIGLSEITDITSDEAKAIIAAWREKITVYEQSCLEQCAEAFNMSIEDVDAAFLRESMK